MSLKTIFIIAASILLTIVLMQNTDVVLFKVLFFSFYASKLIVLLLVGLLAFILGILVGKRGKGKFDKDESPIDDTDKEWLSNKPANNRSATLSDEDRKYLGDS